jgi:hypothetical protein
MRKLVDESFKFKYNRQHGKAAYIDESFKFKYKRQNGTAAYMPWTSLKLGHALSTQGWGGGSLGLFYL